MTISPATSILPRRRPRRGVRVALRYARVLLGRFRWTLLILLTAVVIGTVLHAFTAQPSLNGSRPSVGVSVYAAWMALFAQPLFSPPVPWYLMVMYAAYPVLGFILVGEGVVRLALLMISKRHGEREWMLVLASTYRNHVVLCGLGHLGIRVLEQLVRSDVPVVVLEKRRGNHFIAEAKEMRVPVLIRDMQEDQALIDAGIPDASAVIICSNNDMANLEVAIDARRMNPKIRIVMRLFKQQLASKISGALTVDAAFSSSSLAAPVVAAMSLHSTVISSVVINGARYVTAEVHVEAGSPLAGKSIAGAEERHPIRILALTRPDGTMYSVPTAGTIIGPGDVLVIHTAADQLPTIAAAGVRETL